jgi:hypothetical protein
MARMLEVHGQKMSRNEDISQVEIGVKFHSEQPRFVSFT